MKNENRVRIVVILLIGLIISLDCQMNSEKINNKSTLAKIDDFEITYKEFSDHFKKLHPNQVIEKADNNLKNKVLKDMINQLLTLQEAYRLEYDKSQKIIDISKRKEEALAAAAYEKIEVYDKVLTEQLIRQYYAWSDRELKLWRMKFKCGAENLQSKEKEKKAWDVYEKLQNGADFKKMAALYSEHENAKIDSGSMARINCFEVVENVFSHAYEMSVGEIGKPFYSNNAYYILMVKDVYPKEIGHYEMERPKIVEKLKKHYGSKLAHHFFTLRKNLLAEFNFSLFSENIEFFCNRSGTMKTKNDSSALFNDTERAMVLCKTDINEITIDEFFHKAFQYFWNSLDQKTLVEKLLSKACLDELKKHKALMAHLNEMPSVKDAHNEWQVDFLKSYVIEKEVIEKLDVSDFILKPIYNTKKNSLIVKEKRTVREIFQKTEKGINKVYKLAIKANNFETLEKKYQENIESRTEGVLGPFTKGPHGKLGENAFSMRVGEISKPFRYRGGYSIIKLLSIEPERQKTFDEAKEELKNEYIDKNQEKAISEWYEKIRNNYTITINKFSS